MGLRYLFIDEFQDTDDVQIEVFQMLQKAIDGGQQENGIRPGTVPVALVAGCGKACEIAEKEYQINQMKCKEIQDLLVNLLNDSELEWSINGDLTHCISSTLNICLHGVSSEALMLASKIYCSVSNGSACTSKNYNPSYVLTAMGIPANDISNSIRLSWNANVDKTVLKDGFSALLAIAKKLKT